MVQQTARPGQSAGRRALESEVPADLAPEKGKQHGAVLSNKNAQHLLQQDEASGEVKRKGTIKENSAIKVLSLASEQAAKLADQSLFSNEEQLLEFLIEEIRKHVLGR